MDHNPSIADTKVLQEHFKKRAEKARVEGNSASYVSLCALVSLLESEKLFVFSPDLLRAYLDVLKSDDLKVEGMDWLVNMVIKHSSWRRSDIELNQVFVKDEKRFRVIGIADEPTVTIENVETGEREHHVISSRNFSEFRKVD